jgi:hypothetical protein
VVVERIRVYDPFFAYPYPYAYPPDYTAANFGDVKIKTDRKEAPVYVDGDSDGRTLYKEPVGVIVAKTSEMHPG